MSQARWPGLLLVSALAAGCGGPEAAAPAPELGPNGLPVIDGTTPLPEPLPVVAARVNGQDVQTRNVIIIAEARLQREVGQNRVLVYRQALQEVIARELLLQEAVTRGLQPDPERLRQAYDETRAGYRDEASWELFLGQEGLNEELFRTELRVQHTVNALLASLAAEQPIEVSEQETRAFYDAKPESFATGERLRARHVLLRVAPNASSDKAKAVLAAAEAARNRIVRGGEDFATVAREVSEDAGSRGKGGELAVFSRAEMPPAFADAVFALDTLGVSTVFRTPNGYHVAEVLERLPSEQLGYDAVREVLQQRLAVEKRQRQIHAFVDGLRRKASIQSFL